MIDGGRLAIGYLGVDLHLPLVTLTDDSGADTVLASFAQYLHESDGRSAIAQAGLRPAGNSLRPVQAGSVDPQQYPGSKTQISGEQVAGVSALFTAMHQRISSLVVLDASGSMLETLPGSAYSKIDLVRRAAGDTLRVSSPEARSGLITFQSDGSDRPVISTLVPLGRNGAKTDGERHTTAMRTAVDNLQVGGGTPLYNAVREAYRAAVRAYDPAMINQVVVLSDGRNRDARNSITLGGLLSALHQTADPDRPVRIVAIGYGPDADMHALKAIAAAAGGHASWLRNASDYARAIQDGLFS